MNFLNIFKRNGNAADVNGTVYPAREGLFKFFDIYNCTHERVNTDSKAELWHFNFQAGNFLAYILSYGVIINFHGIFTTDLSNLDLVRWVCNEENDSPFLNFYYKYHKEDNKVNVNMSFFTRWIEPNDLKQRLESIFSRQRRFCEAMERVIENAAGSDKELQNSIDERKDYLVCEQGIAHAGN